MKILIYYLIIVNAVAFVIMAVDKYRAVKHRWRIPERVLFVPAILGGVPGGLLAMLLLRHKTRKRLFALGFPLVFVLQILFVVLIFSL